MSRIHALLPLVLGMCLALPAIAAEVTWSAATGLLPENACPAWTLGTNVANPSLTAGGLEFSTGACGSNMFYLQSGADIVIPDTMVVEARLVIDAGSECVGPCGHQRQAAAICITTAPQVGVLAYVGPGEVLLTGANCASAFVANVANAGAHTYKVVIVNGTSVTMYFDDAPVLTSTTYISAPDHASEPRVLWGEGSSFAYGTSHWLWVRHNAHATGCTTSGVGDGVATADALRPFAAPNPFHGTTSLRFAATRPGRHAVEIYDVAGRLMRRLEDDAPGAEMRAVEWDGADATGRDVGAGTYFWRVAEGTEVRTGTVVRLR